jgi:hypothetical protein
MYHLTQHLIHILEVLGSWWVIGKVIYFRLKPFLLPVIQDFEQRALKGVINREDRKALVMDEIDTLQAKGVIKINFIEKLFISKAVDMLAQKLPDFKVPSTL